MYAAHGEIDIEIGSGYLINRPKGAYNIEGIDALFDAISAKVKQEKLVNWMLVELISEDTLSTPDAFVRLSERYEQLKDCGCRLIRVVCSNSLQKQIHAKVAARVSIPLEFKEKQEDALLF